MPAINAGQASPGAEVRMPPIADRIACPWCTTTASLAGHYDGWLFFWCPKCTHAWPVDPAKGDV